MKKLLAISLISLFSILQFGCGNSSQDVYTEATIETTTIEIEKETILEEDPIIISIAKYMQVNADGGLTLREGPSTEYDAISIIDNFKLILVRDFQDNWAYTEVDGCKGWCCTDYLRELYSRLDIKGKESSAFIEMKEFIGETVGDIKEQFGEDYYTEVRGKSAPYPCMIYNFHNTPYIFYYRRNDAQGGHDNASDNTDTIHFVGCETGGIPVFLGIEIGDSIDVVEEKIGSSLEILPYTGPGIEKPYTELYTVVLFNGYNVRMVFDDATKTLIRITLADKDLSYFED